MGIDGGRSTKASSWNILEVGVASRCFADDRVLDRGNDEATMEGHELARLIAPVDHPVLGCFCYVAAREKRNPRAAGQPHGKIRKWRNNPKFHQGATGRIEEAHTTDYS